MTSCNFLPFRNFFKHWPLKVPLPFSAPVTSLNCALCGRLFFCSDTDRGNCIVTRISVCCLVVRQVQFALLASAGPDAQPDAERVAKAVWTAGSEQAVGRLS